MPLFARSHKCPTCGKPFTDDEWVCSKCGTTLKMDPHQPSQQLPKYSSTNSFSYGFLMGFAFVLFFAGLLSLYSFNSIYWSERSALTLAGVSVYEIDSLLLDIISAIVSSTFFILFGGYYLLETVLIKYNSKLNALLSKAFTKASWGNGLIIGGIISFFYFARSYIYYAYSDVLISPDTAGLSFLELVWLPVGVILTVTGLGLLGYSYYKSPNPPAKV
jgi:hypothetical protein